MFSETNDFGSYDFFAGRDYVKSKVFFLKTEMARDTFNDHRSNVRADRKETTK